MEPGASSIRFECYDRPEHYDGPKDRLADRNID